MTPITKRGQRRRVKGWRKPEGSVYVGRGSRWGNPYRVEEHGREKAVALYRQDLLQGRLPFTLEEVQQELTGKLLLCWCAEDLPCHADVLIEVATPRGDA